MTKTILVLAGVAIAAVLLGSVLTVGMFIPKAEANHASASTLCTEPDASTGVGILTWVHHWDKIIFQIIRDPSGTVAPSHLKTPLDIKVEDNPNNVANIDTKIRDFLKVHDGLLTVPGTTLSDPVIDNLKIDIIDVEYAIVCTTSMPFMGP